MDQREHGTDLQEALRTAIQGYAASNLWTALPATVVSYNAVERTIVAQPTIKISQRESKGYTQWVSIPQIPDVPVVFPGSGRYSVSWPLEVGDEILLVFAARCIDSWWQQGGVQTQAEFRLHDLSDAFAIPGPRSLPNVPASVPVSSLRLGLGDGTAYIEVTEAGAVNILAPGGVTVTGTLDATEEITSDTASTAHNLGTHVHGGVASGGAETGGPIG